MKNVTTEERGWIGHYILGDRCKFRRNTLLTCGDERIVVSTVGLVDVAGRIEEVGSNRYYETMAFKAYFDGPYWEADIPEPITFKSPWSINALSHESNNTANMMHEKVVEELCIMLRSKT